MGNLSYKANEDNLKDFCQENFGAVKVVSLPLHADSQRPKGFAFVEFEEKDALDKAVKATGVLFLGRKIVISKAERKVTAKKSSKEKEENSKKKREQKKERKELLKTFFDAENDNGETKTEE